MTEIFEKLKKYNYWQNEEIKAGFLRETYLNNFSQYLDNKLIKVLIGQRRTGKSYLLRQMIKKLIEEKKVNPQNIFYLNKEIVDFDSIRNQEDLKKLLDVYQYQLKPQGKVYLFLDEIQEIEQWEKIVNSFSQDYKEEYELFITGSNSKLLSGELATYLSGRYVSFDIYPFSFSEYSQYFKQEKNKASFLDYLKLGGLPELYNLTTEETKRHYVASLLDTILLEDIVKRHKIKDAYLLEKLFTYLADNIGNLFSINSVVSYLNSHKIKTNFETVSNYSKYLLQAILLYQAERFDIKGKSILASSKKYYLNDLAFKNYLTSSFDYGLGRHLENLIYLHFRREGWKVYVGKIGEAEVDFVAEKDREKKYIQCAWSLSDEKVIEREFGSLEKITDNYEKIVVSADDMEMGSKNGIKHILAWDFV